MSKKQRENKALKKENRVIAQDCVMWINDNKKLKKQIEQLKIELEKEKDIEQRKSFVLYSTLYEVLAKHNYEDIASTIDQLTTKNNDELCEMYKEEQNIKAENKKLKEENKKLCAGNTFYDYVKELQIDNRQKEQQLKDLQNAKAVATLEKVKEYALEQYNKEKNMTIAVAYRKIAVKIDELIGELKQ